MSTKKGKNIPNTKQNNYRYPKKKVLPLPQLDISMVFKDYSKNIDIYTQLKNIYGALGEMDKFNVMKAKIAEIEAGN